MGQWTVIVVIIPNLSEIKGTMVKLEFDVVSVSIVPNISNLNGRNKYNKHENNRNVSTEKFVN